MDQIIIKGLRVYAYHGVNPEEKVNGQNFELDIILYQDLSYPGKTDNINDTVSYAKVVKKVISIMKDQVYDLLECAAAAVADGILNNFEMVQSVDVILKKPEAPIKADFDYMAVKIHRERNEDNE